MHDGQRTSASTSPLALDATVHCLTGCAIGEVLGLVLSTALGLGTVISIFVAIVLAFVFGYSLTVFPLVGAGVELSSVVGIPMNRRLIGRGQGHAVAMRHHRHGDRG